MWIELHYIVETKRGLVMKAVGNRYEELLQEFNEVTSQRGNEATRQRGNEATRQ